MTALVAARSRPSALHTVATLLTADRQPRFPDLDQTAHPIQAKSLSCLSFLRCGICMPSKLKGALGRGAQRIVGTARLGFYCAPRGRFNLKDARIPCLTYTYKQFTYSSNSCICSKAKVLRCSATKHVIPLSLTYLLPSCNTPFDFVFRFVV